MKNLIARTITGIFFVATIVIGFLNPTAMTLLFALITALSVWEFTGLVNMRPGVSINRFICTAAGVYFFFAMVGFSSDLTPSTVFIPYLVTLIYLLISELYAKAEDPINNWAYTMFSQLYVALPFSLLSVLAFRATPAGVVYTYLIPLCVFVFLWINDTGAYCCGSLLGKHKLFPRVSPGKSWEGSIGGFIFVAAAAVGIWYYTETYGLNTVQLSMGEWIGLGWTVALFGTWGDLVESLFKRTLGIKDSGNILPGHGGMLDRFDSSLLAIPAAVVYLYTLTLL
ncbi:MAG: phosphatidate cytidylyltransferase [Prevotella sp.]|nr:phosphatidate cytidylyltransferase [Prevotella sp.]MCI5854455.1 phosphatidate cytidylyltransferase [Prevotella sp.]MDD6737916.1 phosphatidate cytidylyltransferase [Prevotella sp.]MDY6093312.1 phosphatidate cytidylyltransferase [Prevotella sp.]